MLALNRSLLNREYTLINVPKTLASIIYMGNLMSFSYRKLHRDILRYLQMEYSVHSCKMGLTWSTSTKEVDPLGLFHVYFNFPAPTPRLNSTETSLQLSENITLLAICRIQTGVIGKQG
jgi:hypothetical protein